jgi:hypothetical protein
MIIYHQIELPFSTFPIVQDKLKEQKLRDHWPKGSSHTHDRQAKVHPCVNHLNMVMTMKRDEVCHSHHHLYLYLIAIPNSSEM